MNGRWIDQFPPEREYDLEIDEDSYELQMADAAAAQAAADSAAESARRAEEVVQGLREEIPTKVSELENDSNYAVDANYVHTDNNFTSSEKNKLEGIAAGAEVNINADWNATGGDAFILNKPTKVSDFDNDVGYLTEHQDISGKANAADLAAVATSGSYNDLLNKPSIPNKVSDLTDDSGHYTKPVTGIPASDLEETYLTQHQDISMKANRSEIPTAVSQLDNDAGYITGYTETDPTVPAWAKASTKPSYTASEVGAPTVQEMNTAINNAIGSVNSFDVAVVQTLPSENISTHTIYLVPKTGETNDVYDEYIYINNAWEMVGNTQIDLSNYATKSEIPDIPVEDVQINGTSIVQDGVANVPIGGSSAFGVFKVNGNYGTSSNNGTITIQAATDLGVKNGTNGWTPIVPLKQHLSTFYGLAKAAGDTTQYASSNAVGSYTDEAKAAIQSMLNVPDKSDIDSKAPSIYKAIGPAAIASFADGADDMPLKSLVVDIPATQSGTGDPSPENVRPIVGHTRATVMSAGANLLPLTLPGDAFAGAFGTGDTSIATATNARCWCIYVGKNRDLRYQNASTGAPVCLAFADTYLTSRSGAVIYGALNMANRDTAINSGNHPYLVVNISNTVLLTPGGALDRRQCMLSFGAGRKAYAPRTDPTTLEISFPADAGTVYAGTLTVNQDGSAELAALPHYASYAGETLVGPWVSSMDVYAEGATPTTGAEVVDLGGAATVYQITAEQIRTLKGDNNIWSDAGDVTAVYPADTKSYIDEQTAAQPKTVTVTGTTPVIAALDNTRYKCGEVSTLDITLPASGIVDVVFESGTTPTVLTVTPPTGVTLKWANGFDPDNLDADTTYEINICDGLGVAASWT